MMFGPAAGRLVGIIVETGALVEMADRLLFCLNCPTAYYGKGASATATFFGGNKWVYVRYCALLAILGSIFKFTDNFTYFTLSNPYIHCH